MGMIRLMTPDDLGVIARLDALAFGAEPRHQAHLEASLALYPAGCFVMADGEDVPVGYLFSRQRGHLGWLGVGGVHPEHQNQGYGPALVRRAIQQLQRADCGVIGLSTQTPRNVGTWAKVGFRPGAPTLEMTKPVAWVDMGMEIAPTVAVSNLDHLDQLQSLAAIRDLSHRVQTGLDYTPEVINASTYGWGETWLFGWPDPWAFALLATQPMRPGEGKALRINALSIVPSARHQLPQVLNALEALARDRGFEALALFVDSSSPDAVAHALDCGFWVKGLWIRMALTQPPPPPDGLDLSLWAM